jgi:hypothetical protein
MASRDGPTDGLSQSVQDSSLLPRPELGSIPDHLHTLAAKEDFESIEITEDKDTNEGSTPELAASAPRYRRKSSTFIDGIHDVTEEPGDKLAPAQLYSTMSGRLFHSGRIVIVMVGLPARGKTYVILTRTRKPAARITIVLVTYACQWLAIYPGKILTRSRRDGTQLTVLKARRQDSNLPPG